jgi:hypothetical protein
MARLFPALKSHPCAGITRIRFMGSVKISLSQPLNRSSPCMYGWDYIIQAMPLKELK